MGPLIHFKLTFSFTNDDQAVTLVSISTSFFYTFLFPVKASDKTGCGETTVVVLALAHLLVSGLYFTSCGAGALCHFRKCHYHWCWNKKCLTLIKN